MSSIASVSRYEERSFPQATPDRGAAFAELLTPAILDELRRGVVRFAGSPAEVDDLLQDAFERAIRHFDRFEPGTSLLAWMRTIIRRLAIDHWRKHGRRTLVPADDLVSPPDDDAPPPRWTRYGIEDVHRALAEVPEPLRTTFRLHEIDGLPYLQIAARLGIPPATVGTRLIRARARLRRAMETAEAKIIQMPGTAKPPVVGSSGKGLSQWSSRRLHRSRPEPRTRTSSPTPLHGAIGGRC
jgi:RNA polymerase sigma-70 factor (ECF subfamily)